MSKKKATAISLPLSRTAKIMTSAVGVESVNQDIVALATKATEIFLMDFAQRAYDQSSDEELRSNVLEYDDIHKLVHSDSRYDFLEDSIPKKIKFSEALVLVEEANKKRLEAEEEARKRKIQDDQLKKEREIEREKEKQRKLEIERQKQEKLDQEEATKKQNATEEENNVEEEEEEQDEDDEEDNK